MQHESGSSQVECMRGYIRRRAEEDEASKLERTTPRMQLHTRIAHEGRTTSTGGPTRPRSEATGAPMARFRHGSNTNVTRSRFAEPVTIPIPHNCWQCTYWCLPSIVTVKRCSRNTTPIRKHRSENSANPNPILAALQGMCALDLQPAKQHMSLYKSPTRKDRKDRQTTQFLCSIFYRWKSLQSQKVSTSGRPHVFRIWRIAMSLNQPTLKLGSTTRLLIKLLSILINHATLRMLGGNGVLSISSWRIMIS